MGRAPKGGASLSVILLTELRHVNGAAAKLYALSFTSAHLGSARERDAPAGTGSGDGRRQAPVASLSHLLSKNAAQ